MTPRPTISWSDLRGGAIGVWGLGVEGAANLRRLEALGVDPVLVDDRPPADGRAGREVVATAGGGLDLLLRCDVVVKTPGISRYRPEVAQLEAAGIPVVGGLGLWLEEADRDRVVLVTGTKGKSTTTSIAGHLLTGLGHRPLLGGNIGQPPYDPLLAGPFDYVVVETSSYQATDVGTSPPVVAVTSLFPDHLDWHGDEATYFRDKLSICTRPGARLTVANGDSDLLAARRASLGPEVRWVPAPGPDVPPWIEALGLRGRHNARNAAIAGAVLEALGVPGADDPDALVDAARGFEGLPSRLRSIGSRGGVEFVDDSLSTNVLPTLAALEGFADRRVALLVGGYDRGIDYAPLAAAVVGRSAPTLVLTLPDSGPRIHQTIDAHPGPPTEVVDCATLGDAVALGYSWAVPDGVVLLSPAAPSFGQFTDYRQRADAFADAMAACGPDPG